MQSIYVKFIELVKSERVQYNAGMKSLSTVPFEELYIGFRVIAANGVPGQLVVLDKEKDWVVAFWDHGNVSQHHWFDAGDGPWAWESVAVDENPQPKFVYNGLQLRFFDPKKLCVGMNLIFNGVLGKITKLENENPIKPRDKELGVCVSITWNYKEWKTRNYWNYENFGLNACETIYFDNSIFE